MRLHPVVQHLNSVVTVTLQASFVGGSSASLDATDKSRIAAYGDPKVNLAGTFIDPVGGVFTFAFPVSDYNKGITTELSSSPVNFMTQLPVSVVGQPPVVQGPLDCVTSDPVAAATAWVAVMDTRITDSLAVLRAKTPAQLTTLPDATV
jgi:hypothetical protein